MYYHSPLVTGNYIWQGTDSSKWPTVQLSSFQQNINNYAFHDDPLLDTNTQSRVTCSRPDMLDVLAFCTTQLHFSTSAWEPHRVPSMESFSILPHFNSVLTRITSAKWCVHFSRSSLHSGEVLRTIKWLLLQAIDLKGACHYTVFQKYSCSLGCDTVTLSEWCPIF